jgi:hypothetical protein
MMHGPVLDESHWVKRVREHLGVERQVRQRVVVLDLAHQILQSAITIRNRASSNLNWVIQTHPKQYNMMELSYPFRSNIPRLNLKRFIPWHIRAQMV